MAINIKSFEFNMFGLNTYVVWDQTSREAMIIDPGMINNAEEQILSDYISSNHLKVDRKSVV